MRRGKNRHVPAGGVGLTAVSGCRTARLQAIASVLPDTILSNDTLAALYPNWTAEKIYDKTGIFERHIAGPGETAADLAYAAATLLFERDDIDPASIDFVLLCTQTPDYLLPATACMLQSRLGLRRDCGALDVNLGCSGYVYGLALAKGLIESGMASNVLLLTADTYSKLIHPMDNSVRALFGDGATATLIGAMEAKGPMIGPFVFGTDGSGADKLVVPAGGMRCPLSDTTKIPTEDSSGNIRSAEHLFMDGAAIMAFTLAEVPKAVARLLAENGLTMEDFDTFVFHQASQMVLEALRKKLCLPRDRFAVYMEHCGNTVSSSIPIALEQVMRTRHAGARAMLVGFGVGYSWSATKIVLH